jgi:hypothetical protein
LLASFLSRGRRSGASADFRIRRIRKQKIVFPLKFRGKTALYAGGLAEALRVQSHGPEALAAPLEAALELADLKAAGQIELRSLNFALVVFTGPSQPRVDHEHRDRLWRAFQVPLFEQFCGPDAAVIAHECEAHDGLHLAPGSGARIEEGELRIGNYSTGLTALLDTAHCECGDETPRLTVGGPFRWARAAAA